MPAKSKKQQRLFGMVKAMQDGKKVKGASAKVEKMVREVSPKVVNEFAKTKTKGLPNKKKKKK